MSEPSTRRLPRLRRFVSSLEPPPVAWRGAGIALFVLAAAFVAWLFFSFIAPDLWLGKLVAFGVVIGLALLVGAGVRWGFAGISALPASFRGPLLWTLPLFVLLLLPSAGEKGTAIFLLALVPLVALLGGSIAVLLAPWRRHSWRAWTVLLVALGGLGWGVHTLYGPFFGDPDPLNPGLDAPLLVERSNEDRTLDLTAPSSPGRFAVETLTYGPGTDRQRAEFREVDLVSRSVDGSKLIDGWDGLAGDLRTRYWGFDASELPLQGRVWAPADASAGPFPLVLVVHGNHAMEDFSDPGYAYLGELWASRGFIAVSVDENFLNSSAADMAAFPDGGLRGENDARGWLLLEHVALWSDWNAEPGHRFHGRVDLDRVGLVGHSRGGEAVATAAVFHRLDRYPDDATLEFDYDDFRLRGVAAIAPVDGQYQPRGRRNPLVDIDYFVIHGSLDGDVSSFMGASVYERARFSGESPDFHFKASLYVEDANHGQFNTSWGRSDAGAFFGWALDLEPILDPESQRRVARVALTSFLEASVRQDRAYLPILRDPRHAAAWLGDDAFLVANYSDSIFQPIADFEEDLDVTTGTWPDSRIVAERPSRWSEAWIDLKWNALETHAVRLAWDDRALEEGDEPATWSIELPAIDSTRTSLVFAAAATDGGTLPKDWDDEKDGDEDEEDAKEEDDAEGEDEAEDDETPEPLDWTVELVDAAGERAALPLSHDAPLHPPIEGPTRRAEIFEGDATSEPILRRFALPLADFVAENPAFDPSSLRTIRFVFDRSPRGSILVDAIGLAPSVE